MFDNLNKRDLTVSLNQDAKKWNFLSNGHDKCCHTQ